MLIIANKKNSSVFWRKLSLKRVRRELVSIFELE